MQKLNAETLDVEMQRSTSWDEEIKATFKSVLSSSKTVLFTEDFILESHTFGALTIESKSNKRFIINKTFIEMNKAAYVSEDAKEGKLHKMTLLLIHIMKCPH